MSADKWDSCPRCADTASEEIEALEQGLKIAYGLYSLEDYEKLREQLEAAKRDKEQSGINNSHTFREDYEFYGADTGTLIISYRGQCTKCGLSHKIDEERVFYTGKK